jgi:GxxExxY protein
MLHESLTSDILNLGYGFLEKVYENALAKELAKCGHQIKQQAPIQVYYQGEVVGEYFADILVDEKVILELKATAEIAKSHESQLVNYLKATGIQVRLVLNFGPKAEFRRKIFTKGQSGTQQKA